MGDRVRYANSAYEVLEANNDDTFVYGKYAIVPIGDLSGVDRTMGYYVPATNDVGLDLSLLINGIEFPGVDVHGLNFSINDGWDGSNGWDIEPWDLLAIGANGYADFSDSLLDTVYESKYPGPDPSDPSAPDQMYSLDRYSDSIDTYDGVRASDVDVDGAAFIDAHYSHSPEELIPGITYDTLSLNITSRTGFDYTGVGYAFDLNSVIYFVNSTFNSYSFSSLLTEPVTLMVFNLSTGKTLLKGFDYTVDWVNSSINVTSGTTPGDTIRLTMTGVGGGDIVLKSSFTGADMSQITYETIDDGTVTINSYNVLALPEEIRKSVIIINGIELLPASISIVQPTEIIDGNDQIIDPYSVEISFPTNDSDVIVMSILGHGSLNNENMYRTNNFRVGGSLASIFGISVFGIDHFSDDSILLTEFIMLDNEVSARLAQMNAIVELNGLRLRSPEGIQYISTGRTNYLFPQHSDAGNDGAYYQGGIADDEVVVFYKGELLEHVSGYTISPPEGVPTSIFGLAEFNNSTFADYSETIPRYITLTFVPEFGAEIEIYITTESPYRFADTTVNGYVQQELIIDPTEITLVNDDMLNVISYSDVSELNLLTETYVGPTILPPDGNNTGNILTNIFESTQSDLIVADRLWVTLNGARLNADTDFEVFGNFIRIFGSIIEDDDVVIITTLTSNTVQDGLSFRYFKDMRDNSATYKVSAESTTKLVANLLDTDDIIYVEDAQKLPVPQLNKGVFGMIMISGERILYRSIDFDNNTISGLRRGNAGTGADSHSVGSLVYNTSKFLIVPGTAIYGGYNSFLRSDITIENNVVTSTIEIDGVEVEVDDTIHVDDVGLLSRASWEAEGFGNIIIGDFLIKFTSKDFDNSLVSGLTLRRINTPVVGLIEYPASTEIKDASPDAIWYNSDGVRPSNGVPLQYQDTIQANFIKS